MKRHLDQIKAHGPRLALLMSALTLSGNAQAGPQVKTKPAFNLRQPQLKAKPTLTKRIKTAAAHRARQRPNSARPAKRKLPNPYKDPCVGLDDFMRRGGQSPFGVGEELAYELTVSGANIGKMELKVGKPRQVEGKLRLPLFGRARTSAFIAAFKRFEGRYMSMVDPSSLRPLGLKVESTYGEEDRWERVRFDKAQRFVGADVLLQGRELRREYDGEHDLTDILTLLYVARTLELQSGMQVCQDVFASRRLWRMTAKVEGSRQISTPAGQKDVWVVKTEFDRKPTHGLNNRKRPHMEVDIYLAKNASQTPLQFVIRSQGVEATGKLVRWSLKGTTGEKKWTL